MRSDIVPGGVFPDYELPDHTNTKRRLSELQGEDPLILTLAWGHFCPKGRPSVEDLRHDLRAVTREIRPDWDLSTPGLREAWDAGDRSRFHGWNRWSPQRFAAELKRVAG
jgi:hypothetical protein